MGKKEQELKNIQNSVNKCIACELSQTCTNKVFSDGSPNAKIMLIGEAPGADEDATGTPFVGRAGKYLTQLLTETGFDRQKDLYIANTIKCRPPNNRVPSDFEKKACRDFLLKQIEIVKPKVIILCGATALKSFANKDYKISQIRGEWLDVFENIKAITIFHPSFLLRKHSEDEGSPRDLTRKDLSKIKKYIETNN